MLFLGFISPEPLFLINLELSKSGITNKFLLFLINFISYYVAVSLFYYFLKKLYPNEKIDNS